ncbi:MAG: hypothetical protein OXU20_16730, partial [Myxococcales bacterium]|nr:hypothetical protein [Myxococcales bacterium]
HRRRLLARQGAPGTPTPPKNQRQEDEVLDYQPTGVRVRNARIPVADNTRGGDIAVWTDGCCCDVVVGAGALPPASRLLQLQEATLPGPLAQTSTPDAPPAHVHALPARQLPGGEPCCGSAAMPGPPPSAHATKTPTSAHTTPPGRGVWRRRVRKLCSHRPVPTVTPLFLDARAFFERATGNH